MKPFLIALLLLPAIFAAGQKNIPPSNALEITGLVKQPVTFSLADIKKYPSRRIKDVKIVNHLGEKKGKAQKMHGVPILDLLQKVEIDAASPKLLSTYYLIFEATDGYQVVYSWNEIFNSPIGQQVYVITQKDGAEMEAMPDRILIVTALDFNTGRRYIKGLSKITIARIP